MVFSDQKTKCNDLTKLRRRGRLLNQIADPLSTQDGKEMVLLLKNAESRGCMTLLKVSMVVNDAVAMHAPKRNVHLETYVATAYLQSQTKARPKSASTIMYIRDLDTA